MIVGEEDEISIKDVADAIVKAVGFEGDYQVSLAPGELAEMSCPAD